MSSRPFGRPAYGIMDWTQAITTLAPGLSWDALLKKTGVELELLTDYDQHLFIENGLRATDFSKPKSHILYLDANNLCGWAMSQPLPTGSFRWADDAAEAEPAC